MDEDIGVAARARLRRVQQAGAHRGQLLHSGVQVRHTQRHV